MKPLVRRCTILDIVDMLAIAVACYPPFNQRKAVAWAEAALLNPQMGFFRTEDAWGCTALATPFYDDDIRAAMMFLAGRNGKAWEAVVVLRAMVEWSRRAGAVSYNFGEDTGMRMDILAKRIGAKADRPQYRITLAPTKAEMLPTFWRAA